MSQPKPFEVSKYAVWKHTSGSKLIEVRQVSMGSQSRRLRLPIEAIPGNGAG